ncbi:alcohol dehydrogenase [Schizosaccharomyces pombe]
MFGCNCMEWVIGSKEHQVKPGKNVLVLGTSGVFIFALQFALAAGTNVTTTSYSDEKLAFAKKLGATHTISYKKTPQWASPALKLTNGVGDHHVIEVGGEKVLPRSITCLAKDGMVSLIGFIASEGTLNLTNLLIQMHNQNANTRGIVVVVPACFVIGLHV